MKATDREEAQGFLHNALHGERVDRIMGREPIEDFQPIELEFLKWAWIWKLRSELRHIVLMRRCRAAEPGTPEPGTPEPKKE